MEVVVVDDGSPDGTAELVEKDLIRIYGNDKITLLNRGAKLGLGSAYIDGLNLCKGDYVVLMDADLSHHVSFILNLIIFHSLSSFLSISTKWRRLEPTLSLELDTCPVVEFTDGT